MFDPPIDDAPSYDELVNKVLEQCSKITALEIAVKNLTACNNARDEICAPPVESDNPCDYCTKYGIGNCTWCGPGRPMFKGRKLSPIA